MMKIFSYGSSLVGVCYAPEDIENCSSLDDYQYIHGRPCL